MSWKRTARDAAAALAALACLAQAGAALAIGADHLRSGPQLLASNARERGPAAGARPPSGAAGRGAAQERAGARAQHPLDAVTASGAGQAGYVHYFLLTRPDDTVEVQVGIELPGDRIAWSFPGLGVVVSPFIQNGTMPAGGTDYEVSHLYGMRPFPGDASMAALRSEIAGRVQRWVEAQTPYCENDGPRGECMSCLGFVLRVLFPGRTSDYPDLPRDFVRAGTSGPRLLTRDLLLYLTGMLDLPSREARLQRIAQLTLPDLLREDLLYLVDATSPAGPVAAAGAKTPQDAAQKRPAARQTKIGTRAAQRKRL